jgi:hypothetical protein
MLNPMNENDDYDDFFDEAPTVVLIRRLIEEAIADSEAGVDDVLECDEDELDPTQFCAIGTR